jgi:tetratricopeptide (TPR) repeat protein
MRSLILFLMCCCLAGWAQSSNNSVPSKSQPSSKSTSARTPNLAPPRSDRVDASTLPDDGRSSSKDTQIDLSPPSDDAKAHPKSSEILMDEGSGQPNEVRPWNPHKAAKDIEVGDFYFKRKNYRAAEDRYREALYYKDNDAVATYHLAECLEKQDRPEEAQAQYESYLNILPHGPEAESARKAIERIKSTAAKAAK